MRRILGWGISTAMLVAGAAAEAAGNKPSPEKAGYVDSNPGFTESNCPTCRSKEHVIPIVYGLPDESLMEQSKKGEVALGGCIIDPKNPRWHCKSCRQSW